MTQRTGFAPHPGGKGTTSNCGAVDVIEALGVDVECEPDIPKQAIERIGICAWNGFVKWLRPTFLARAPQEIRFGNTVNFVGPLLTPTMPKYKVMGVKSLEAVDFMARLLRELGTQRAFVMHGLDAESGRGMDELSTLGASHIAELRPDGSIASSVVTPRELGLPVARYEDVASSREVPREALTLLRVIAGDGDGPREDIVCLNAAPLLYVMERTPDLVDGVAMARAAIRDGRAMQKLRDWVTWQNADPGAGLTTLERMLAQI